MEVLETNCIGYMLNVSLVPYQELQGQSAARLYVYENIREDAHVLYGFLTKVERELFLLLISVSGVVVWLSCDCIVMSWLIVGRGHGDGMVGVICF